MKALLQTLMHVLELCICVGVAWLVLHQFNLDSDQSLFVVTIVLNALAKFSRASKHSPIEDYVNKV